MTAGPSDPRMTPLFDDGTVRLYVGDFRDVLPTIDTADVRTVITDPPYGETSLEWDRWPAGWPSALPESARQLWCFGSFRMFLDRGAEITAGGWAFGQEIVWEKHNGSGFAADRFRRVHEFATQWYRGAWGDLTIRPVKVPGATQRTVHRKTRPAHTGAINGSRYETERGGPKLERSVISVRSCHGHAIHPTEKPLGILEPLVRYSTDPGDIVLDVFAGSGAVLDACRQNGRRADYAEAAARRLAQGALPL